MAHSSPLHSTSVPLKQGKGLSLSSYPFPNLCSLTRPLSGCLYSCTHSTRLQLPGKTRGAPLPGLHPTLSTHPPAGPDSWAHWWDMAWWSGQEGGSPRKLFSLLPGSTRDQSLSAGQLSLQKRPVPKPLPASQWCTGLKIQASNESHIIHVIHKYQQSHKLEKKKTTKPKKNKGYN